MTVTVTQLDDSVRDAWNRISNFRSRDAIGFYSLDQHVDVEKAEEHFVELLKYLCLNLYDERLTPSRQLDHVWHAFILQTPDYAAFATRLGRFVHHRTTFTPQSQAYSRAIHRYRRTFGVPHPIWMSGDGDCDNPNGPDTDPSGNCDNA